MDPRKEARLYFWFLLGFCLIAAIVSAYQVATHPTYPHHPTFKETQARVIEDFRQQLNNGQ